MIKLLNWLYLVSCILFVLFPLLICSHGEVLDDGDFLLKILDLSPLSIIESLHFEVQLVSSLNDHVLSLSVRVGRVIGLVHQFDVNEVLTFLAP